MGSGFFLVCRVPHPNVCASMDMGVDVFRFSEIGIKVDGFIGSAIVHFIGTCKKIKKKKIVRLRADIFLVGRIYYDMYMLIYCT